MNGFRFDEMPENEIDRYVKESIKNSEEYEYYQKRNSNTKKTKSIKTGLAKMYEISESLDTDFDLYDGKNSSAYINKILSELKSVWGQLLSLQLTAKDSKEKALCYINESDVFMRSKEIAIKTSGSRIHIILPVLIPHKKMVKMIPDYANAYRSPIFNALKREFPGKRPVYEDRVCMIIVNNYKEKDNMIDYDNHDYSHLINCIAGFFLKDDSPEYYDLHITGRVGESSYSEIFLDKSSKFAELWNTNVIKLRK